MRNNLLSHLDESWQRKNSYTANEYWIVIISTKISDREQSNSSILLQHEFENMLKCYYDTEIDIK